MFFQMFILGFFTTSGNSLLVRSLYNVLDYGIVNEIYDENFLFGTALAQAQLEILEENVAERNIRHIKPIIRSLHNKCNTLIDRVKAQKDPLMLVVNPDLWKINTCPVSHLNPASSRPLPTNTPQDPGLDPDLSDECIRLLLNGCRTPTRCVTAELTDNARDYQTTHQVLYWTIYIQKCTTKLANSTTIKELIKQKCAMTLREHRDIEARNLPPEDRDLYYEQTLLCGIHGFSEFLSPDEKMIISLQHVKGCFTQYTHSERPDRECDLHFSAVAAGVIALLIRHRYYPL